MKKKITKGSEASRAVYSELEGYARRKVQEFIQALLEEEVTEFLGRSKSERRAQAVDGVRGYRNGYGKPRQLAMSNGTIRLRRPRVRDCEEKFESQVLPLFKRRSAEVGQLLPELYLHGLAKGDFELALRGLLGEGAPLSASSIGRLKAKWQLEYEAWKQPDLSELQLVYAWADGIYVKAGLDKEKAALLVIIGATVEGRKVLLACESGQRESKLSWAALLRDLKARGLKVPRLMIADGHLGIWSALSEILPESQQQRCWNHKILNVLDGLSKQEQPTAKELLRRMAASPTQAECEKQRDAFVKRYQNRYPKATERLVRDWERMITFTRFRKSTGPICGPATWWSHPLQRFDCAPMRPSATSLFPMPPR
ncbi:MAG TPA: IS256 family transposase [Terriglobia bacterium]|nr:IS256 family transposase [Terriglobia bacterium]